MRYSLLVVGAVVLVAVATAADPPKLGPEWTYDEKMKHYKKMMPIKVVRSSAAGSGQNYYLDLQHDKVLIYDETGDNSYTSLRVNDTVSVEIEKNRKGGPAQTSFEANKCRYVDLNGDGVWDGWYDKRGDARKVFIWRDNAWIPVCDSKAGFTEPRLSLDRKTEYTWDGKEWKSRPVDR
jgi:hypothetical protein